MSQFASAPSSHACFHLVDTYFLLFTIVPEEQYSRYYNIYKKIHFSPLSSSTLHRKPNLFFISSNEIKFDSSRMNRSSFDDTSHRNIKHKIILLQKISGPSKWFLLNEFLKFEMFRASSEPLKLNQL